MPKHCIFVEFFLIVGSVQGALRKKLFIAPFVERLKAATLGKSLTDRFCQYLEQLLKHCISAKFLLTEG